MSAAQDPVPVALHAIHARRHAWNWRLAWRLVVRAAVLAAMGMPIWTGDFAPAAWQWAVLAAGAASFLLLPVVRVVAGRRAVDVPLRVRGAQTPFAWFATLWWILPIYLTLDYGHSNNGGEAGREMPMALELAAIVVVPILTLLIRRRTVVEATETGIQWRGPGSGIARGEYPDLEAAPLSGVDLGRFTMVAIWYALLAIAVMEGLWFLAAGFVVLAVAGGIAILRVPLERAEAPWDRVSLYAAEAGNQPALVLEGVGTLDIGPVLAASARGDRLLALVAARGAARSASITRKSSELGDRIRELARRHHSRGITTTTVIRPAARPHLRHRRAAGAGALAFVVLFAVFAAQLMRGGTSAAAVAAVVLATLACVALVRWLVLARARVIVEPGRIRHRTLLRTVEVRDPQVAVVYVVPTVRGAYAAQPGAASIAGDALLLRHDGTLVLRIASVDAWGEERMRELANALGAHLELGTRPLAQEQLGVVLGGEAYRMPPSVYLVALWISAGILLGAVLIALVTTGNLADWIDDRRPDPPLTAQERERRALGERLERVLPENFARIDGEPLTFACFDDGIDSCPISPELRELAAAGATPAEQASRICRCDADDVTLVVPHDEEPAPPGTPGGGTYARASLSFDGGGQARLFVHYADDGETMLDVICASDDFKTRDEGLLAGAPGTVAPRCDRF